ncbi:hypothetical protein [Streptomyces subrutilus]|nr:hypothetical protein OG479_24665 [Streptomyces subrutilus]
MAFSLRASGSATTRRVLPSENTNDMKAIINPVPPSLLLTLLSTLLT